MYLSCLKRNNEAQAVIKYAHHNQIPLLMLGNGSNMVVRDGGVRGIVLRLHILNEIRVDGTTYLCSKWCAY